jgi:hypothetical protein
MKESPEKEIAAIEALIDEAIPAGFFQIDIDTSTLVDLSQPTLAEQQRQNSEISARLTKFIRSREPKEVPISVGGEIGEVGKENSTPEEFRAYMDGYLAALGGVEGIAKVSIQTGSSHGGTVGPDGTVQRVAAISRAGKSRVAREEWPRVRETSQRSLSGSSATSGSRLPGSATSSEHGVTTQSLHRHGQRWLIKRGSGERWAGASSL